MSWFTSPTAHARRVSSSSRTSRFARRALTAAVLAGLGSVIGIAAADARPNPKQLSDGRLNPSDPEFGTASRILDFGRHFHNVGQLNLTISNWGVLGDLDQTPLPGGQWPPGSDCEYLWSGGLWVGGLFDHCEPIINYPNLDPDFAIYCEDDSTMIQITDTLVTTAQYDFEFWPDLFTPEEMVYETFEGRPGGIRGQDDDGDGWIDEDLLNGRNDDPFNDGRIDEDYAAISQQMFTSVYRDTARFFNERIRDPSKRHTPIGLEVVQESYQYTAPAFDDFVGLEFRIRNFGLRTIRQVFVGFFVDSDVGCGASRGDVARNLDDRAGYVSIDTVLTIPGAPSETLNINVGYMRDEPGGEDEISGGADGWFGSMFLGHSVDSTGFTAPDQVRIHAYKSWSNGEEDPDFDGEAYNLLTGLRPGPFDQVIDVGSQRPDDWRQLLSAGPFFQEPSTPFAPDCTIVFQSAFAIGLDQIGLIGNAISAQRIFNRPVSDDILGLLGNATYSQSVAEQLKHWSGASAPPPPAQRLIPGDHRTTIEWDNFSERVRDVLTGKDDFAGYQIWKAVGWRRESAIPREEQWFIIADISKEELARFDTGLGGVGKYRFIDTEVKNGFPYWYAVTAYDSGDEAFGIPPIYGKFSQAAALVYPKWGPVNSLEDDLIVPNESAPGMVSSTGPFMTLDNVHVAPNPYKERADWDLEGGTGDPTGRRIYFLNLPERATIRIFSLTGDLLQTLEHRWASSNADPTNPDAGTFWNLVTRNNQEVTSGIYIYQIDSDVGTKIGKFAIIK
ncbi:MAG: hypothetical protein ACKVU1_05880 [bacterium]